MGLKKERPLQHRVQTVQKLANLDKYNFRQENLIERKITEFSSNLKPIFTESISNFRPDLENLLQKAMNKGKTLNWLREKGEDRSVQISLFDQADSARVKKLTLDEWVSNPPQNKQDRKRSPQMSSPKAYREYVNHSDKELRDDFQEQLEMTLNNLFQSYCDRLVQKYPLLESALAQIVDHYTQIQENEEKKKIRIEEQKKDAEFQIRKVNLARIGQFVPEVENIPVKSTYGLSQGPVTLEMKTYFHDSLRFREIGNSYEALVEENQKLRNQLQEIVKSRNRENSVTRENAWIRASSEMQLLIDQKEKREKAQKMKQGKVTDDLLEDRPIERIVQVEFFNELDLVDEKVREQVNAKLALMRNNFQNLIDINTKNCNKLKSKIKLMNQLAPEAFSIANLEIIEIFKGLNQREPDPEKIWRALEISYGEDYFLSIIEEKYGKRFVANFNALYTEVEKVQQEADKQYVEIAKRVKEEVKALKLIIQSQKVDLAMYRENFRQKLDDIETKMRVALEAEWNSKEMLKDQEIQNREDEIHERYFDADETNQKLRMTVYFQKLLMISLAQKITTRPSPENDKILAKLGEYLSGEKSTKFTIMKNEFQEQIDQYRMLNKDLTLESGELKATIASQSIQIVALDDQITKIGTQISMAENQKLFAYEEKRKAMADFRVQKKIIDNCKSIIQTNEREIARLKAEIKKLTKGKLRPSILQAEMFRKEKLAEITEKGVVTAHTVYCGVPAGIQTQTETKGISGHLLKLEQSDYDRHLRLNMVSKATFANLQPVEAVQPQTSFRNQTGPQSGSRTNVTGTGLESSNNEYGTSKPVTQGQTKRSLPETSSQPLTTERQDNLGDDEEESNEFEDESGMVSKRRMKRRYETKEQEVQCCLTGDDLQTLEGKKVKRATNKKSMQRKSTINRSPTLKSSLTQNSNLTNQRKSEIEKDVPNQDISEICESDQSSDSSEKFMEQHKKSQNYKQSRPKTDLECDFCRGKGQGKGTPWKDIQTRLSEVVKLEKRLSDQVRYEVDKAFEMVNHSAFSNFVKRDRTVSQAYLALVGMCKNRLTDLNCVELSEKLQKERDDALALLQVENVGVGRDSQAGLSKLLNFVVLENLNSQVLKIVQEVAERDLQKQNQFAQENFTFAKIDDKIGESDPNRDLVEQKNMELISHQNLVQQLQSNANKFNGFQTLGVVRNRAERWSSLSPRDTPLSLVGHSLLSPKDNSQAQNSLQTRDFGAVDQESLQTGEKEHQIQHGSHYMNTCSKHGRVEKKKPLESFLTIKSSTSCQTSKAALKELSLGNSAVNNNSQAKSGQTSTFNLSNNEFQSAQHNPMKLKITIDKVFKSEKEKQLEKRRAVAQGFSKQEFQNLLVSKKMIAKMGEQIGNPMSRTFYQDEKRNNFTRKQSFKHTISSNFYGSRRNVKQETIFGTDQQLQSQAQKRNLHADKSSKSVLFKQSFGTNASLSNENNAQRNSEQALPQTFMNTGMPRNILIQSRQFSTNKSLDSSKQNRDENDCTVEIEEKTENQLYKEDEAKKNLQGSYQNSYLDYVQTSVTGLQQNAQETDPEKKLIPSTFSPGLNPLISINNSVRNKQTESQQNFYLPINKKQGSQAVIIPTADEDLPKRHSYEAQVDKQSQSGFLNQNSRNDNTGVTKTMPKMQLFNDHKKQADLSQKVQQKLQEYSLKKYQTVDLKNGQTKVLLRNSLDPPSLSNQTEKMQEPLISKRKKYRQDSGRQVVYRKQYSQLQPTASETATGSHTVAGIKRSVTALNTLAICRKSRKKQMIMEREFSDAPPY